jgi:hypothetical protein
MHSLSGACHPNEEKDGFIISQRLLGLNRDRGAVSRPPPTPPGMRVRSRRFGRVDDPSCRDEIFSIQSSRLRPLATDTSPPAFSIWLHLCPGLARFRLSSPLSLLLLFSFSTVRPFALWSAFTDCPGWSLLHRLLWPLLTPVLPKETDLPG